MILSLGQEVSSQPVPTSMLSASVETSTSEFLKGMELEERLRMPLKV
jgi:hypothetical protein